MNIEEIKYKKMWLALKTRISEMQQACQKSEAYMVAPIYNAMADLVEEVEKETA